MNKKKIIMILILVFVLILGGAGILYKQLGQKLAPDLLATQAPQKTESTEASLPTTQEGESEKILAPDFTVYDLDAAAIYGVYSLPTTYFIDAEGNAIAQATGAIDEGTLQRGIDMIISDR